MPDLREALREEIEFELMKSCAGMCMDNEVEIEQVVSYCCDAALRVVQHQAVGEAYSTAENRSLCDRVSAYVDGLEEPHRSHFSVGGGKNFVSVEYSDGSSGAELIDSDFYAVVRWITEMIYMKGR